MSLKHCDLTEKISSLGMAGLSQRDLVLSQRAEAQFEQQKRDEILIALLAVRFSCFFVNKYVLVSTF